MTKHIQENPLTLRLWREVRDKVFDQAREMYGDNVNATINLLLMRGLGFQDYQIEQSCREVMRSKHESAK